MHTNNLPASFFVGMRFSTATQVDYLSEEIEMHDPFQGMQARYRLGMEYMVPGDPDCGATIAIHKVGARLREYDTAE